MSPMSLLPVVSLVHYSPFGMLYSTATMTIPFKLTDYQRSSSFNVSLHVLSLSRRVFIMQYLLPAVSLSYRVSPTIFSYWYPVQYCNNDIPLKFTDYLTQLLPSVSHSMSCLSPDVPLTCSVSFLLSPPTIVSLAHYSPFDLFYSPETMTTTFKFTVYPTQLLFQCLHDLSPSAVLSSCSVSFLPSPFPVVSLTYYTLYDIPTVLQQCTSLQLCCFLT